MPLVFHRNIPSDVSLWLQIDTGLMTPTMKIRRDKVAERYKEQIAKLYRWNDGNYVSAVQGKVS